MNMHICAIYFTEILFVRPLIATGTNCKLVSIKQHYFLMKKNNFNHNILTLKDRDINYKVLTLIKGGNLNIPACL